MRERPWDDLGGGPAGSTLPRGRRKRRRVAVPSWATTLVRREGHPADSPAELTGQSQSPGAFSFLRAVAANAQVVSSTVRVADASSELDQSTPTSVIVRAGCSSWPPSSPPGGAPNLAPARGVCRSWRRRQPPGGRDDPVPTVSPHRRADGDRSCGRPRHNRRRLPGAGAAGPPGPRKRRARAVRRVGRRGTRADVRGCARPLVVE